MNTWHRASRLWWAVVVVLGLVWWGAHSRTAAGSSLESAAALESEAVVVRLHPSGQAVVVGQPFAIAVQVSGLAAPLSAFQFDLGYDPALVRPVGTTPGTFLSSTGRAVVCPEPAYPGLGVIRLACAGAGEATGPLGSGPLATLTFTALVTGTSPLTLSAVQLPGGGIPPASIAATAQGGQVTIVLSPEGHSIYLPLVLRTDHDQVTIVPPPEGHNIYLPLVLKAN